MSPTTKISGCPARASVGSGEHAAGAIERHAERLRERRRRDAGRPQDGLAALDPLGGLPAPDAGLTPVDAVGVDAGDDDAGAHLDAEPLERLAAPRRAAARETSPSTCGLPSSRTMRADSGRMRRKSCTQRLPRDLRQRAGELDAGRSAADDDERQQAPLRVGIGLALGRLERQQHPPPDLERIVERLQPGRARRPLGMAEVGVRRAGGDDQVVVGDRACGAGSAGRRTDQRRAVRPDRSRARRRAAPRRSADGAGSSGSATRCRPATATRSRPDTAAAETDGSCGDRAA